MSEFSGMVVIVTGGASGIGAAIADEFARRDAHIAVLDRATREDGRHHSISVDVSDDTSVRAAVDDIAGHFGRIDVVVNNAGIGAQGDLTANSDAEWHRLWDINVLGIVRVTRAALPYLRRSPNAAVVNLSSVLATAGVRNRTLYTATKGAVLAMTRAMAADHLADGIRFNCVNPGTSDTPWVTALLAEASDPVAERYALEERQPHGRLVSPQEVATAVAYLASPTSGSTTGTSIAVDGGMQELRLAPS